MGNLFVHCVGYRKENASSDVVAGWPENRANVVDFGDRYETTSAGEEFTRSSNRADEQQWSRHDFRAVVSTASFVRSTVQPGKHAHSNSIVVEHISVQCFIRRTGDAGVPTTTRELPKSSRTQGEWGYTFSSASGPSKAAGNAEVHSCSGAATLVLADSFDGIAVICTVDASAPDACASDLCIANDSADKHADAGSIFIIAAAPGCGSDANSCSGSCFSCGIASTAYATRQRQLVHSGKLSVYDWPRRRQAGAVPAADTAAVVPARFESEQAGGCGCYTASTAADQQRTQRDGLR